MGAIETLRDALFGNPPSPTTEPSREGTLAAFTELYGATVDAVYAAASGITIVPDIAARDEFFEDVDNQGKLVFVNDNNGSASDPANGIYEYVDEAPRISTGFYAGLTAVVQPLVDEAQAWAEGTEPGGPGTFSAREYAEAAEADADAIVAAAATVRVPTYLDDISTGNRGAGGTNVLTITTGLTISAGSIANLINGSATNDDTNGVRFATGQDVTNKAFVTVTINRVHASKLVGKLKIKQSGTQSYGTYQPRVQDAYGTWSNHGSTVVLGGSTEYEIDLNALADVGIIGFELLGTTGTTPANTNRVNELEIQSVNGPRKDVTVAPRTSGLPGDRIVNGPFPNLAAEAVSKFNSPALAGGVACNYEWWFDNPVGVDVAQNRRGSTGHFDYSAGTYGTPTRTRAGLRFNQQMITASVSGVRELMILKRCAKNMANTKNEISSGVAGNPIQFRGASYRDGNTVKVMAPNGALMPVFSQISGSYQINAFFLNRGGWVLMFVTLAADFTGTLSLGGDIDEGVTVTNRADEFEIACMKAWPSALPNDAARLAEADWVCRELAFSRGIRVRGAECTRKRDIIAMLGESQMAGEALVSVRPKQIREMASVPHVLIQAHERADGNYALFPAPFVAGSSNRAHALDTSPSVSPVDYDGRRAGPEWKVAINHYLASKPVPLGILHGGATSSMLGGATGLSWLASTPPSTGLLWFSLTRLYDMWTWLLEHDEAPVMVSFAWSQGWNNIQNASPSDYQDSYDVYYEAMIAAWLLYTGLPAIRQIIIQMPDKPAGNTAHDATKQATVKAKLQAIVDADPTNRVIVNPPTIPSNDAWGQSRGFLGDNLHYTAPLLDYHGDAISANTPFSAP